MVGCRAETGLGLSKGVTFFIMYHFGFDSGLERTLVACIHRRLFRRIIFNAFDYLIILIFFSGKTIYMQFQKPGFVYRVLLQ